MEVALVFVDVLQGFETFVHRTEMLQRREATVDKVSTYKHHSKKRRRKKTEVVGVCLLPLIQWG